jgi:hypothetical protein
MAAYKTPKPCIVHSVELRPSGGAIVRYRCGLSGNEDEFGRQGPFKLWDGGEGFATYPSKLLPRVRELRFRGLSVRGPAKAHFVLSPAAAVCRQVKDELQCTLEGNTSPKSLAGRRRRRQ